MFRIIIVKLANKNFLTRQVSFISNSFVSAWLLKDIFTSAIINKSFAGRSLYIQLIIYFGISVFMYLLIILGYRLHKKAHQKNKLTYFFSLLQIFILLASYLTIIFNFDRWMNDLAGFLLFFLVNLILSTALYLKLHYKSSNTVWNLVIHNSIWIFVILIIVIFFFYPITITFDSAHYLWLADLIRTGEWASWDPIRNPGFPILIFLSLLFFGYNQFAILRLMVLALILLYVFSCKIAYLVIKPNNGLEIFFINLIIFIILALDATIFGYFHTLLTEYIAATIAMLSCFMALKLYKSTPFTKSYYLLLSYFLVMIPFSWHIKQPYIGAALFPLLISIFLILLRQFSWKKIAVSFLFIVVSLLVTLGTNVAWDSFLVSQDNPMREERHITTFAERRFSNKIEQVQQTPLEMGKRQVDQYLENINFYIRGSTEETRTPSLTQGFQNKLIAHRMYLNPGKTNIFFSPYEQYTDYFLEPYAPPNWLNNLFLSRVNTSYFLFTITYLLLPVSLLLLFIIWFRRKEVFITSLLILGGTSFLNAVVHLFTHPIDRYLFLGYPLNLLLLTILLFKGLLKLKTSIMK